MKFLNSRAVMFGMTAAALAGGADLAQADMLQAVDVKDAVIFGAPPSPVPQGVTASQYVDTNTASGAGPVLLAGADGSGNIKRSLIQFDVSSIPMDATITGVTVTLYLAQVAGTSGNSTTIANSMDRQFGLYAVNQSWGEGPSGAPTGPGVNNAGQGSPEQNGDSTWTYAFYNSNAALAVKWNNGAANTPGGNIAGTESGRLDLPAGAQLAIDAPFTFASSAGMVADVQAWVDGTSPNNGWMLLSDNLEFTKQSFVAFWSKDSLALNAGAQAPQITVTYTVPTPEAGTLGIFAAGGVSLIRRRRR